MSSLTCECCGRRFALPYSRMTHEVLCEGDNYRVWATQFKKEVKEILDRIDEEKREADA